MRNGAGGIAENGFVYVFGTYTYEPRNRVLARAGGERIRLSRAAKEILIHFLEHPGEVIGHEELLSVGWKDSAEITNYSLTQVISELREALGDRAEPRAYVETVHKKGYSFVAPVRKDRPAPEPLGIAAGPVTSSSRTGDAGAGLDIRAATRSAQATDVPPESALPLDAPVSREASRSASAPHQLQPQSVTTAGSEQGRLEEADGVKAIGGRGPSAGTRTQRAAVVAAGLAAVVVLGAYLAVSAGRSPAQVSGTQEIEISPQQFTTQSSGGAGDIRDEFLFNTRENPIPGLQESDGVDLSPYDLEFTFQSAVEKAQVQLWYKGRDWANVYSRPYAVTPGKPIRYDPFGDGRAVSQFDDFTHIWAIGAKVLGAGTEEVQLTSARLIRR